MALAIQSDGELDNLPKSRVQTFGDIFDFFFINLTHFHFEIMGDYV